MLVMESMDEENEGDQDKAIIKGSDLAEDDAPNDRNMDSFFNGNKDNA